jgi:D-alanyl-D-alanine dipeptidase
MRCELIGTHPDFRPLSSIAGIAVDLRYAGPDNFAGRDVYGDLDCAWLHRHAAAGVEAAVHWLGRQQESYTLLVFDALRPHRAQEFLWQVLEGTGLRQYLADPARGSIHSFGMALDVGLLDKNGCQLDMGTGFDDMHALSHPALEQVHLEKGLLTERQIANRTLLRTAMLQSGFHGIQSEWWHFDFGDRDAVRRQYERID